MEDGHLVDSLKIFNSQHGHNIQTDSGAHPASYSVGASADSMGVMGQGHESDHSPPSTAEVKNGGAIPSLHIHLHCMVLN
jgi:hypothetical protein